MHESLTPDEKAEMYKAIGYSEGETPTDYPQGFVEFDLCATIHKIEIKFIDESNVNIMTILLKELLFAVEQMPASKSMKYEIFSVYYDW